MEKKHVELIHDGWQVIASYWEAEMFHTLMINDDYTCLVFNETLDKVLIKPTKISFPKKINIIHYEGENMAKEI